MNLAEIGEFIARDKPIAANRWVETLMAAAERAAAMPLAGRRVPEFNRDDLREVIKRGYRIVYLVAPCSASFLAWLWTLARGTATILACPRPAQPSPAPRAMTTPNASV